ncbi:long-chain-fatty-acid--CoA ligase [Mycolicibacterium aichiense]|uniref:Long-chain-fatty-acid--CoA ligase FadD13 n=2 Tax=Mycolicibacterium TaxID=1866885 RepID=A0AAD1MEV2_9MYCO|nr:long-chain-fatty-acid--CoA ligase [Mycolicibacterium aichiense]MCV7016230.1 long-chain-fatty-acid--CoA ligase [Mycolicibacterium aichiense]BBX10005.1 long-chain-fatty-acid--CoA ligase [Mycolicibacterium aichiense]STZ26331.1 acyl-CoA synthetase [Mycolicibacterium aichiense]
MQPPEPRFLDDRPAYWAEHKPDGQAISYLDRSWTWAQWDDRIRRLAGALVERGIGRGDVVAFLDKNHPACVELQLAAGSLGAATAVINFRLAADEMDYVLNDSGAKLLIVGTELMGAVDKIRDKLTNVSEVIEVTPDGADGDGYEALLATANPVGRPAEVDPEDAALVMYSSGTTGRPKGVVLSHRNVLAHTMNAATFEFGDDDKNMVAMPLFHVGGSAYVQYSIHAGVPTIMTREADGASLAGALLQGANRTFLVPAVLGKVLESGEDAVKLFSALRTFVYGASPMPPALLKSALKAWPDTDFIQVYGLTEVCGAITQLSPEVHRDDSRPERLISAGQPSREVEVRVVDTDTLAEVPVGQPGELWFRTPQLMKGYHNKPEATASTITEDGWFRSGDIGRVDEDGFIFVEDRLKDMIISGGENIYSVEVERVLTDHPAVLDAAVFGVPDEKWGESVKAVVELSLGGKTSEEELIAWCRERLAHYKCPRSVEISEALPRNPTGKLLKRDLRNPYWENRGRAI